MGMLSHFYQDMKTTDKKKIALIYETGTKQLASWLRCLTDLRNRIAHYSRLYYWQFPAKPKMPTKHPYKDKVDNRLFTQLLVVRFLYPDKQKWCNRIATELGAVIEEYQEDISLEHIGFPQNWEDYLM